MRAGQALLSTTLALIVLAGGAADAAAACTVAALEDADDEPVERSCRATRTSCVSSRFGSLGRQDTARRSATRSIWVSSSGPPHRQRLRMAAANLRHSNARASQNS
jgi:hypothetical protein